MKYINFNHYYDIPIVPGNEENYIEYGKRLREVLIQNLTLTQDIMNDEEVSHAIKDRYIDYIQSRIINLALNLIKNQIKEKLEDSVDASEALMENLNSLLNLSPDIIQTIHLISLKISNNYIKNTTKPSTGEINLIREHATSKNHTCYICTRELALPGFEDSDKRNKLEIEHIFPRVYGGSRNKENLTICCEHCNKIKGEKISAHSIHFESFMTSSDKAKNVERVLTKEVKASLIMKQNLKCASCEKKFFDIIELESLYAIKKDKNDIFHYFNTEICCSKCVDKYKLEGVKFELQL